MFYPRSTKTSLILLLPRWSRGNGSFQILLAYSGSCCMFFPYFGRWSGVTKPPWPIEAENMLSVSHRSVGLSSVCLTLISLSVSHRSTVWPIDRQFVLCRTPNLYARAAVCLAILVRQYLLGRQFVHCRARNLSTRHLCVFWKLLECSFLVELSGFSFVFRMFEKNNQNVLKLAIWT